MNLPHARAGAAWWKACGPATPRVGVAERSGAARASAHRARIPVHSRAHADQCERVGRFLDADAYRDAAEPVREMHGSDLIDPVNPDHVAQAITARALLEVLAVRAPHLVREARQLSLPVWIDVATGRRRGSGSLAAAVPVMT